jgi:hypothetical protein
LASSSTSSSSTSSSPSSCPTTLELIRLLFSNVLLTESESSTSIPNSVALVIVLELNVFCFLYFIMIL